jgi:hypothetical protein
MKLTKWFLVALLAVSLMFAVGCSKDKDDDVQCWESACTYFNIETMVMCPGTETVCTDGRITCSVATCPVNH